MQFNPASSQGSTFSDNLRVSDSLLSVECFSDGIALFPTDELIPVMVLFFFLTIGLVNAPKRVNNSHSSGLCIMLDEYRCQIKRIIHT